MFSILQTWLYLQRNFNSYLNISFFFTVSSTTYTEGLDCWTKKMSWTHTHTHTRNGQELRTRSIFVSQIIKKSFTITQGVHVRSTSRPQLKISHTKSSHTSRRARNSLPLNLFHVYYWCHLVTEKSTANLVTYFFFFLWNSGTFTCPLSTTTTSLSQISLICVILQYSEILVGYESSDSKPKFSTTWLTFSYFHDNVQDLLITIQSNFRENTRQFNRNFPHEPRKKPKTLLNSHRWMCLQTTGIIFWLFAILFL
jgi:hypothetical protein